MYLDYKTWNTQSPKIVVYQEIFSFSRAVEISIQYLLLRTWAVYFSRKTSLAALDSRVHRESRQSFGRFFGLSQQTWVLPLSLSSAVATRYLLCDWSTLGELTEQENETKKWLATSFTTLMHAPKEKNADWLLRLPKLISKMFDWRCRWPVKKVKNGLRRKRVSRR